jgi:5-methylcytosine-specific restriction protein A
VSRSVPLWVGKTPDAAIPKAVKLRVFAAYDGRCWLTGKKIMPGDKWQIDHKRPLILGGEHAESNLAPVLDAPHKAKSASEVSAKAKADRIRAKHLGIHPPTIRKIQSRGFPCSRPVR